jgi:nucleoside-diphosphate-sugar epimerase
MRCLVTGGAGFIGSNLALYLEEQGHEVIIIDNFSSGNKDNLKGFKGKVIEADVSKPFEIKDIANIPSKRYNTNHDKLYAQVQIFHEDSLEKILTTKSIIEEKTGLQLEEESE